MPKTSNSSSSAYAQPADLLVYLDARMTGDLVNDQGIMLTPTAILTDPTVAKHLLRASGRLEAICLKGRRYQPADLQALTGASREYMIWVVCGLALESLRWRRANLEEIAQPFAKELSLVLDELANGKQVFGFLETEAAGLPDHSVITGADLYGIPSLVSNMDRYFGTRRNRLNYPL